jgi:hypothetical protein
MGDKKYVKLGNDSLTDTLGRLFWIKNVAKGCL